MSTNISQRIVLSVLLIFISSVIQAQSPNLKFITYNTNNGLLHNFTKKCIEDKDGFIWVVTEIGISRFDGVNFKNFQHDEKDPHSIPHNVVYDIAVDKDNRIWLGTEMGLCFYNSKKSEFTAIDITGTFDKTPRVLGLVNDDLNNTIWFITDKALYQVNRSNFRITSTSCKNPTPGQINHVYLSSDNKIWIAVFRNGFLVYDIKRDLTTKHAPETWVSHFLEGSDNIMWLGHWHSEQLVAWNMKTGDSEQWWVKDENGKERHMIITGLLDAPFFGDSLLLVSTLHMGIRVFNKKAKKFTGGFTRDLFVKYSLPVDFTNYIYKDSKGIIWVCTWNGLSKINVLEQQFRTTEIPFLNTPLFQNYNLIEGIENSDQPGIWWMCVNGSGVFKYNPVHKTIVKQLIGDIRKENLEVGYGFYTEFIIKTDDGIIWVGNDLGLVAIQNDQVTQYDLSFKNERLYAKTACMSPEQKIWITTARHFIEFDPHTRNYRAIEIDTSLHGPYYNATFAESAFYQDSILWTGNYAGLYRFNFTSMNGKRLPLYAAGIDSIQINTINSMVIDDQETIYMGTPVGLGIYNNRTGNFQLKGREDNAYPILWRSMLRDKNGHIWIYTPHALFRYDPLQDQFLKFTTAEGIHNFSSDPTHLFSFQNNFYIGYRGAFTEFDPLKVDINQTVVKPQITEVLVENQVMKLDIDSFSNDYLVLPMGQHDITFHFTGIDYTNSDKISFSFRLDEESEWHEAGTNRSATYTNLGPGNHTFQLKARNSSGILNEVPAIFKIYVPPTLLQRWWFWPAAALIFVAIVILLANRRIKKIREEERLKTETNKIMAQLETKLLRSQMNPHFIFNSLNSIQKYIWENKEEDAAEYLAQFAKLIRAILENSGKEFISLREEMEIMKLYISLEHRRSNGKFDYQLQVAEEIHQDEVILPPLLIQPYIENAIWHGVNKKQGHGHIGINIQQKKDLLEFIIDDDGVGRTFKKSQEGEMPTKVSMGTSITQQRISHLQTRTSTAGVRTIDKEVDGIPSGTTVIVTIPVKHKGDA